MAARGAAAVRIKRLPAGFIVPARPIHASKPPSGSDWVHEIKHDGATKNIQNPAVTGLPADRAGGGKCRRHACGYALAAKGHDTRAIQQYLGHRSITSTPVYAALASGRFKDFWRD